MSDLLEQILEEHLDKKYTFTNYCSESCLIRDPSAKSDKRRICWAFLYGDVLEFSSRNSRRSYDPSFVLNLSDPTCFDKMNSHLDKLCMPRQ